MKARYLCCPILSILLLCIPLTALATSPVVPAFHINAGLNDTWRSIDTRGQGFFITVFPDTSAARPEPVMFVGWFTYDVERPAADVTAMLGEPGHRWLTAYGPYSADTAILDIELTEGGVFDSGVPAPTQGPYGTMTVKFTNCSEGEVTYTIPSVGISGTIPITRVANDNVAACEALSGSGSNEVEFWFHEYIHDDNSPNEPFHMREAFAVHHLEKVYDCLFSSEYTNAYPEWTHIDAHYAWNDEAGFYIENPEEHGRSVGIAIVNDVVCGDFFDASNPVYELICDGPILTKVSTWAEATEGDGGYCEPFP